MAALVAWLESHGLKLETVSLGRTTIAFSGTVSQVEEAFHTTVHSFAVNGNQFYSNTTDPQIPEALAPVVKGIANLNTIRPKPQFVHGSEGKFNPQNKRLEPAEGPKPGFTSGGDTLYIVPGDAATIYDTPNSYNANFSGSTSYNGAGVNIGIGGAATIIPGIIEAYRQTFLGNSTSPIFNYCTSSSSCSPVAGGGYDNTDNADEAYIDTELAGGMAPGAAIYYYASTDLTTGIQAALDANVVDIFSLSFGDCESDMGTSGNAQLNSLWEQAAAQGIAVTVSSGDSGSAGCDDDNTQTTAKGGLQVSGFASTPYNIAVGGTDFYPLTNSFSTYVSTSQGSSSTFYRTALKYIPESTWNDSSKTDDFISTDVPVTGTSDGMNLANIVAGSGGVRLGLQQTIVAERGRRAGGWTTRFAGRVFNVRQWVRRGNLGDMRRRNYHVQWADGNAGLRDAARRLLVYRRFWRNLDCCAVVCGNPGAGGAENRRTAGASGRGVAGIV